MYPATVGPRAGPANGASVKIASALPRVSASQLSVAVSTEYKERQSMQDLHVSYDSSRVRQWTCSKCPPKEPENENGCDVGSERTSDLEGCIDNETDEEDGSPPIVFGQGAPQQWANTIAHNE
jgi:hypothetical protein